MQIARTTSEHMHMFSKRNNSASLVNYIHMRLYNIDFTSVHFIFVCKCATTTAN